VALNGRSLVWRPRGLSDALDGSNAFNGAMRQLVNLIPDPTTRALFVCRPASDELTWGSGAPPTTANINSLMVIGEYAYFMAAGSGATAANDIPYAYNLTTGAFTAIAGITAANTPTSPLATGDWTPPTMALIGTRVTVTHPGFNTAGGYFVGWLDISNPAAPSWSAGNVATQPLTALPVAVTRSRDGRAYYAVDQYIEASDASDPTTRTNADQVLAIGDSTPIIAFGPLALGNVVAGGVVQSVIVFKEIVDRGGQMFQVTGDYGSSWAPNQMNVATSTVGALSVVQTHLGLAFISPDGLRLVDFTAAVSDPLGALGDGVAAPFVYAEQPTRIVGACAANTLRYSVKNGGAPSAPWQEYWFNFSMKGWTGPHSFPAAMIASFGSTFIVAPQEQRDQLFQSDVYPSSNPSYTENGTALTWTYEPVLLPDNDQMTMNAMVETNIMISLPFGTQCNVVAQDEEGGVLDQVLLLSDQVAGGVWGTAVWGSFTWGSSHSLKQRQIAWTEPLVFKQLGIQLNGGSDADVRIGNLYMRYEALGYNLPYSASA